MNPVTLLLAEDHTIVREGFRKMLEYERDFMVVGEAQDGREAIMLVNKLRPAVVLMDIEMPLLNGLEATRQVLKAVPDTKVLILSAHSDSTYLQSATASGAAGFLLKHTSAHDVCQAIREVQNGKTFFSPSLCRRPYPLQPQSLRRAGRFNKNAGPLTTREMEVLQRIAESNANKTTAMELGISVKTVEKHRWHLMRKLNIHDTAGLTRYAISAGIIDNGFHLSAA